MNGKNCNRLLTLCVGSKRCQQSSPILVGIQTRQGRWSATLLATKSCSKKSGCSMATGESCSACGKSMLTFVPLNRWAWAANSATLALYKRGSSAFVFTLRVACVTSMLFEEVYLRHRFLDGQVVIVLTAFAFPPTCMDRSCSQFQLVSKFVDLTKDKWDSEVAMRRRAIDANKDTICNRRPRRISSTAIKACLIEQMYLLKSKTLTLLAVIARSFRNTPFMSSTEGPSALDIS